MRHIFSITLIAAVVAAAAPMPTGSDLLAQGVTTAAIEGTVRATDGTDVDGAEVQVVNAATGFVTKGYVRHGRFLVQGLEVGGPYTVTVRRLGFHEQGRESVVLKLAESLELDFEMQPATIPLDTLRVSLPIPGMGAHSHGGTATTIPDSLLHRLPSLNRNFYDFVRLVPQISTKTGLQGLSGGGVGLRFNNYLIDGVSDRSVAAHQTPALLGGNSLPLDAVKEYQVLLAPYDV